MSELNKEEQINSLTNEIIILKSEIKILKQKMRLVLLTIEYPLTAYNMPIASDIFWNKESILYIDK